VGFILSILFFLFLNILAVKGPVAKNFYWLEITPIGEYFDGQ
jgi:hypothetical protein